MNSGRANGQLQACKGTTFLPDTQQVPMFLPRSALKAHKNALYAQFDNNHKTSSTYIMREMAKNYTFRLRKKYFLCKWLISNREKMHQFSLQQP